MKRLMFVIVLMLLVSCVSFGQANKSAGQNVVQEITALENAWIEAAQKHDVSWFEKYLADSYTGTDEEGKVYCEISSRDGTKGRTIVLLRFPSKQMIRVRYPPLVLRMSYGYELAEDCCPGKTAVHRQ